MSCFGQTKFFSFVFTALLLSIFAHPYASAGGSDIGRTLDYYNHIFVQGIVSIEPAVLTQEDAEKYQFPTVDRAKAYVAFLSQQAAQNEKSYICTEPWKTNHPLSRGETGEAIYTVISGPTTCTGDGVNTQIECETPTLSECEFTK